VNLVMEVWAQAVLQMLLTLSNKLLFQAKLVTSKHPQPSQWLFLPAITVRINMLSWNIHNIISTKFMVAKYFFITKDWSPTCRFNEIETCVFYVSIMLSKAVGDLMFRWCKILIFLKSNQIYPNFTQKNS